MPMLEELEINDKSIEVDFARYAELKKVIIRSLKNNALSQISLFKKLECVFVEGVVSVPQFVFENSSLKEIHLSGKFSDNKFSKPYPDLFAALPALIKLTLGNAPLPFPPSVWKLSTLKSFTITIEDCRELLPGNFSLLTNLEELSLSTNHFTDQVLTEIASLPKLRTLTLNVINVNKFPLNADVSALGKSRSLEEIILHNAQLPAIPVAFRDLTTLKRFHLEATDLRRFNTTLDLYFENLPESLVSLHMDYIGFSFLPENVGRLQNLKSLYLTSKEITKGYENLLLLPHCEYIYFRFYRGFESDPLIEKIIRDKGEKTKYSELLEYFNNNKTDMDEQKRLLRFIYKDPDLVASRNMLLQLLGYPNKRIREEAFAQLVLWIENPFASASFDNEKAVITITGKIKQRKTKELSETLHNQGYTFRLAWDDQITHVVLSPTEVINNPLLFTDSVQLALPEHLIALLEREDKPFLKIQDEATTNNLVSLLFSEEESNILLVLHMMLEGGIPDKEFTDFTICYLLKNFHQKETKDAFRKVIEKHCSAAWQYFLKASSRKSILEDSHHKIIRNELIDLETFLKKGLEIGYSKSRTWFVYFFDRVIDFKPDLVELALTYLVKDNTLDLLQTSHWLDQGRANMTKSLSRGLINMANLKPIERIVTTTTDFADLVSASYSFFANLKTLTNLKEIYLSGVPELSWTKDRLIKIIAKSNRELPNVIIHQIHAF